MSTVRSEQHLEEQSVHYEEHQRLPREEAIVFSPLIGDLLWLSFLPPFCAVGTLVLNSVFAAIFAHVTRRLC